MTRKQFTTEKRGVSPVIGVILMVAITVILAAVIGTFVLGLGDQVSDTAPQASFDFEFHNGTAFSVTHEGGNKIASDSIEISVEGNVSYANGVNTGEDWVVLNENDPSDQDLIAGTTIGMKGGTDHSGKTVRVIWSSSSGGDTQTIASAEWP